MSFFDALGFGGRDNSAGRAGKIQSQKNQEGIDALNAQFGQTYENFNPFLQGGTDAFGRSVNNATQSGFEGNIANILGGDAFKALRDERLRATEGQLAAGGMTRSGTALQEISNVPTNLAFQIEKLLSGRTDSLANTGFNAARNIGEFEQNNANAVATLLSGEGSALANGIFGDERARQAQDQGQLGTLEDIVKFAAKAAGGSGGFDFGSIFGGGGGGGGFDFGSIFGGGGSFTDNDLVGSSTTGLSGVNFPGNDFGFGTGSLSSGGGNFPGNDFGFDLGSSTTGF